ncbi:class I SAM-dependent methyltransferase [Nocardioides salsibiostraticola]
MTVAPTRQAANYWPGLDVLPSGPKSVVAAKIARRLFLTAINRLHVTVRIDGKTYGKGGPAATIHRPDEFFARIGDAQLIGFGEAYLTGAIDTESPEELGEFLTVLAAEIQDLVPRSLQKARKLVVARPPREHKNEEKNTQDNIAHHYDLSNDLFDLFLDPTLSYSCALFDRTESELGEVTRDEFEEAQGAKIERLLDQALVAQGHHILEIGSGWGELAIRAARRGARVTTITLSVEQKALADERIAAAGYADMVSVELCDYRAVQGEYDAVLSVEMIEAVGWEYWQTYFETIDRVLKPGGRASIQAITMPHDRMLATRRTYTWINKYIFPGGFLPSVKVIDDICCEHTALRLTDRNSMGLHYAQTLRLWDEAFLAAKEQVLSLGFDETFLRMWHFYLEYSRAGFASRYIDVNQLTFTKAGAR